MERLFENLRVLKKPKLPGTLPLDPTRGAYLKPPAARVIVLMHVGLWPKSQSFIKNKGQQKCLDKALAASPICFSSKNWRKVSMAEKFQLLFFILLGEIVTAVGNQIHFF